MIDAAVSFAPARDVAALDLWEGTLPDLPGVRTLQVEPKRWWIVDGVVPVAAIAGRGALTPIGGGLIRATITGPSWRDLFSVSGFYDTHHPAFGPRAVARTVIHHVAVTIAVTGEHECEVYCAASYAPTLEQLWRDALGGR